MFDQLNLQNLAGFVELQLVLKLTVHASVLRMLILGLSTRLLLYKAENDKGVCCAKVLYRIYQKCAQLHMII